MKMLIFLFFFFELIKLSFSLIPIWNLENSSVILDNSEEITIFKKDNDCSVWLTKKIETENSEIKDKNYIVALGEEKFGTLWEDIEKSFHINYIGDFVCPKGSAFLYQYKLHGYYIQYPENFNQTHNINDKDKWELICFKIGMKKLIFQGFLNQDKIKYIYAYNYENGSIQSLDLQRVLYDILPTEQSSSGNENSEYKMYSLVLEGSNFLLKISRIIIDKDNKLSYNGGNSTKLSTKSDYLHGYFDHNKKIFYWITVDKNNENYFSGYSSESINQDSEETNITLSKSVTSPLQFLKNITIKDINMIRNTQFAYYEIESEEDKKIYHGIIDIKLNKVIFNTDEVLKTFKPLRNLEIYSMLAITENSAYQICLVRNEKGECMNSCPEKNLILDTEKGNYCGDEQICDTYLLKPDDICIKSCNTSIYISKETNCGLCNAFYTDKIYKIFGDNETCLEKPPEGTFILYKEWNILQYCNESCSSCNSLDECTECKKGYTLINKQCIKNVCNENCKDCIEYSDDNDYQNCTECPENRLLQEDKGNCIEKCSQGYYKSNDKCLNCHNNCKSCSKGYNETNQNCEECNDPYFLIKAEGFPKNCVNKCPDGTTLNNKECIKNDGKNSTNTNGETEKSKPDYMLLIFIIVIVIILLIITFIIIRKYCFKRKNDGELINDINTELRENNELIE